ncbi:hypothetical protein [Paenibacillus silviterrae]|uniref:hypothetical protein n=1 Tax=Paenibacillus silviterrae TaxID=3242194 RepID=UPI0025434EC0|nr:hypothetical protein [Paenibacillus chinjuensis]
MKKTKQPGDNISLKTKKTEDPSVMQWINAQTNLMDSLRYLIENEIYQNGVRNLQAFIPTERNVLGTASLPKGSFTHEGMREMREGRGEVAAAGHSAPQAEPERPVRITQPQPQAAAPPDPAGRAIVQPDEADDDIADEDIEAWV